jgi:hypothetical protein
MYRLTPAQCKQARDKIEEKIQSTWKGWAKSPETSDYALILCRAATYIIIKRFLKRQDSSYEITFLSLVKAGVLQGKTDEIFDSLAQKDIISESEIRTYIKGNGEQDDGWRAKGLSRQTCHKFICGKASIKKEIFNFLCRLLEIDLNITDNGEDSQQNTVSPLPVANSDDIIPVHTHQRQSESLTASHLVIATFFHL